MVTAISYTKRNFRVLCTDIFFGYILLKPRQHCDGFSKMCELVWTIY